MFHSPSRSCPVSGCSEYVHAPLFDTRTIDRGDFYPNVLPAPITSANIRNRPSEHVYCDPRSGSHPNDYPSTHALASATHIIMYVGPTKLTLSFPSGSPQLNLPL